MKPPKPMFILDISWPTHGGLFATCIVSAAAFSYAYIIFRQRKRRKKKRFEEFYLDPFEHKHRMLILLRERRPAAKHYGRRRAQPDVGVRRRISSFNSSMTTSLFTARLLCVNTALFILFAYAIYLNPKKNGCSLLQLKIGIYLSAF